MTYLEHQPYLRVGQFLASARAVHLGNACFTQVGAEYLGVPFSFPTMAQQAPWAPNPPDDVAPLRAGHQAKTRRTRGDTAS